ncbi:MAG TPA: hypothetical protein PK011_11300, partial [Marinagarivorans sp.]|nr:hypothetical protein [Marinagarivorans sp.]
MATPAAHLASLSYSDEFIARHIGPSPSETQAMLAALGLASIEGLMEKTLPAAIRSETTARLAGPCSENQALSELKAIAAGNRVFKSYLGLGYHPTFT